MENIVDIWSRNSGSKGPVWLAMVLNDGFVLKETADGPILVWGKDADRVLYGRDETPIQTPPEPVMNDLDVGDKTSGAYAYKLRLSGFGWKEIAIKTNNNQHNIMQLAKAYAKSHDLSWPVERIKGVDKLTD